MSTIETIVYEDGPVNKKSHVWSQEQSQNPLMKSLKRLVGSKNKIYVGVDLEVLWLIAKMIGIPFKPDFLQISLWMVTEIKTKL